MNKQTRKEVDALWLEWGALQFPYGNHGLSLIVRIHILKGEHTKAAQAARQLAHSHLNPSLSAVGAP